jgi:uncharacterized protein YqgC (DUF456 family)
VAGKRSVSSYIVGAGSGRKEGDLLHTIVLILALLLMLVGLVGTVLPAVPGLPLIWIAMLGYAIADQFRHTSGWFLMITLLLVILTQVAEHLTKAWGARRFGAGRAGTWGAVVGSLIGLFFIPVGLLLGPFVGAMVGELLTGRQFPQAVRAGLGGVVGVLGSIVVNLAIALTLIVAFLFHVIA